MAQTILVLGATSPVGRALIRAIPDDGSISVRVTSRPGAGAASSSRADVTTVEFDYNAPETYADTFTGVDKIFLMTPFSNAMGVHASFVAQAANAAGVKHIVVLSALGTDKAQDIQLFAFYRQLEESIQTSEVPYTLLRSAPLMDNFLNIHPPDQDGKVHLPLGDAAVCWIAAEDVAAVALAALTQEGHEGMAYDLTGPQALTLGQATAWINRAAGMSITPADTELDTATQGVLDQGFSPWVAENLLAMYGTYTPAEVGDGAVLTGHSFLEDITNEVIRITEAPPRSIGQFALEHADKLSAS